MHKAVLMFCESVLQRHGAEGSDLVLAWCVIGEKARTVMRIAVVLRSVLGESIVSVAPILPIASARIREKRNQTDARNTGLM